MRRTITVLYFSLLAGLAFDPALGQVDYGTRLGLQRGGEAALTPQGPDILLGALDPSVRRWYLPQETIDEHKWRQWESTNYAHQQFQRYVSPDIEGNYFYDFFGNYLTQGWLVYNVSQSNPEEAGTAIFKAGRFRTWFSEVVIASEQKGQYAYALTVSNNLRTTFTPMVLSKPWLDAVQFDMATDKYKGTFVYAQASAQRAALDIERRRTNSTTLIGGRFIAQVGDFVELGLHTVNAHHSNTRSEELLVENWFTGSLTEDQNQTISSIEIVLRDDSPDDGVGGAAYFASGSDVIITYREGQVDVGKDIRFEPVVQGGAPGQGFIQANGNDEIRLSYDFTNADFLNRASADRTDIVKVEFRLVVANDYQIWMSSDRQTDGSGAPVLLLVTQANGNIQDASNLRVVSFEAGLPTATHILGGTLKASDVLGFNLYGEYDLNWNYRKYPNPLIERHKNAAGILGDRSAPAWMVNLSKQTPSYFLFGEAYSMDPSYSTQAFVTDDGGVIDYNNDRNLIELVEDNDDQDRVPDTFRADWAFPDLQVFPGWDQNNDFVPDINQNDSRIKTNSIPDYEEPFLRYTVDRPEFLFGVDMNNNFWVDQYENDDEPDYPYPRDHRGFNAYGGFHLTPNLRLSAGAMREDLISSDQKNHSTYAVLNYNLQSPRLGRFRIFEMAKIVEDDIPNPLLQWAPNNVLRFGSLTEVEDPLLARDTWVNQFFAGHSIELSSFDLQTKVNYTFFRQLMSKTRRQENNLDPSDFFFGAINKASYSHYLGRLRLTPRWKSEFIKQSRDLFTQEDRTTLMELFSLLGDIEVLRSSALQAGVEYVVFNDFDTAANDVNSITAALQFSNESEFQGYRIKALVGLVVERKDFAEAEARTETQSLIAVYAGL